MMKGGALQSLTFVMIAVALVFASPARRYFRSANFAGHEMGEEQICKEG